VGNSVEEVGKGNTQPSQLSEKGSGEKKKRPQTKEGRN